MHLPDAQAMAKGSQFNGWVNRKLFVGIEEIKATDRREMIEGMKTLITNRRMGMETKGELDQFTGDNAANGMITTNHTDGLPLEPDERRYAVWFCAQQCADDLVRDGMDGEYFPDLDDLVAAGRAPRGRTARTTARRSSAHYLRAYADPGRDGPGCGRCTAPAPRRPTRLVAASRGRDRAQEILEAVDEGRPGFARRMGVARHHA